MKVVKNKVAPPFTEAEFDIMYNEGISSTGALLDLALEKQIVEKRGSWMSYKGTQLAQGRDAAKEVLKNDPALYEEIETAVKAKLDEEKKLSRQAESLRALPGARATRGPRRRPPSRTFPCRAQRSFWRGAKTSGRGACAPRHENSAIHAKLHRDDLRRNPPVISRFLPREAAHHRALVIAHAGRAEPAVHQRRHEPVRADLPRPATCRPSIRRAPPTPRNASAPAASTTTSKTSASTPITTRSSRCSATGASAITSRRKPSTGRGNWSSRRWKFPPKRALRHRLSARQPRASPASSTRRRYDHLGADLHARPDSIPPSTSSTATRRTTSG